MIIERATDASFINAGVNHPAVRPFVQAPPGQVIDLTPVVQNPDNFVLQGDHGGMVLMQVVPSVYEAHTQVLPEGRGEWGLKMAMACGDWLFTHTNATEIITRVPTGNLPALALTRACGMRLEARVMQELGGEEKEVDIFAGRIQDWIKVAPGLVERGKDFHRKLRQRYDEAGIKSEIHPSDEWHDRHVGAACGMFMGGQPIKGCLIYNRWAAMALAPRITLVSLDPLVIDITEARLEIVGDDFRVHQCQ